MNKIKEWLTDAISICYQDSTYDLDEINPRVLEVVFNGTSINNYVSITYGDDDFYYEPIFEGEVEALLSDPEYGESYISYGYSDFDDDGVGTEESKSTYLRSQSDWWFVTFTYECVGKTRKYKDVDSAIKYALSEVKAYFNSLVNDSNYLSLGLQLRDEVTEDETKTL